MGEGLLIVGSILLALALDAWWQGLHEGEARAELVRALQDDFENTRTRLVASIALGESLVERNTAFLVQVQSEAPVSVDSMVGLATAAFVTSKFIPALASYRAAVSAGDLSLIRNREVLEALAEFDQALEYFDVRS